jgi:hypothetical protein
VLISPEKVQIAPTFREEKAQIVLISVIKGSECSIFRPKRGSFRPKSGVICVIKGSDCSIFCAYLCQKACSFRPRNTNILPKDFKKLVKKCQE